MLLMLWLQFLTFGDPQVIIQVENNGRYLDRIAFGQVRICKDGSFLANTFHHVWHWDSEGKLINMFGGRGQGPDEFQAISEIMFTGEYYWVIDGARAVSKIFDTNGEFLHERATPYRQFITAGDQLFVVDRRGFSPDPAYYPPVLQEIEYQITPHGLNISDGPLRFKKVTRRQAQMLLNFKQSWIVPNNDGYLVMDQLEPIIRIYDAKALQQEKNRPLSEPWEPDFIPTVLKGWVSPPDAMPKDFQNNKSMLRWWQSWSRINYFAAAGQDLIPTVPKMRFRPFNASPTKANPLAHRSSPKVAAWARKTIWCGYSAQMSPIPTIAITPRAMRSDWD